MFRTIKVYPNGETPKYTFFMDFDIAAHFGKNAILDTYKRVKAEWGKNAEAWAEVIMSVNLLSWDYADKNEDTAQIFADLYEKAYAYVFDDNTPFTEEERSNIYQFID